MTVTPRGTTYITVSSHGFYYRELLSRPRQVERRQSHLEFGTTPPECSTGTQDVWQVSDSSSPALVEQLNKRAKMFNPAWLLYAIGVVSLFWGLSLIANGMHIAISPCLPFVTVLSDASRKFNRTDEYSLLLARYGQPSTVVLTVYEPFALRTAVYDSAHLGIVFVPNGCVDAYAFYEAHKDNTDLRSTGPIVRQTRSRRLKSKEKAPSCIPQADNGSTIVRYQDAESGSSISVETAQQRLDTLISKSSTQPPVTQVTSSTVIRNAAHVDNRVASRAPTLYFNQDTLREEEQRIRQSQAAQAKTRKYALSLLFIGVGLVVGAGFLHRTNRLRRVTRLMYQLDETARQNQSVLEQSLTNLAKSNAIWRVTAKSPTYDWKRNAGAGYLVSRTRAGVRNELPPRVESSISVKCIDLGSTRLYFFPDMILYWEGGTFRAVTYDDLALEQRATRFIEDEQLPRDANQVDHTWRYVRKDGGPDRRFNNNRKLPVMLYGALAIKSPKGVNLLLNASNVEMTAAFADLFLEFQARYREKVSATRELKT